LQRNRDAHRISVARGLVKLRFDMAPCRLPARLGREMTNQLADNGQLRQRRARHSRLQNDTEAVKQAEKLLDGQEIEIWEGTRMVTRIELPDAR
jgi:hypothetical protein